MSRPAFSALIYQCPQCRSRLLVETEGFLCTSADCRMRFIVVDGIPKFLVEDGIPLPLETWQQQFPLQTDPSAS